MIRLLKLSPGRLLAINVIAVDPGQEFRLGIDFEIVLFECLRLRYVVFHNSTQQHPNILFNYVFFSC